MKTLYKELTPQEFRERMKKAPVAYLPLGTLEWHGEHMPLGTDSIQPEGLFPLIAEKVGGIVFPTLFLGPDRKDVIDGKTYYGMDAIGQTRTDEKLKYDLQVLAGSCYWVEEEIFENIFRSILAQMQRVGFKVLVAHGHGPSTMFFINHSEEFYKDFGIKCIHCWAFYDDQNIDQQYDDFQTGHGGVNETSTIMALRPDLVHLERIKDIKLPVGVSDDPGNVASAEIGNRILEITEKRIVDKVKAALKQSKLCLGI